MTRQQFDGRAWYHGANNTMMEHIEQQGHLGGTSGYITQDPAYAATFPKGPKAQTLLKIPRSWTAASM